MRGEPDKTTRSLVVRFFSANADFSWVMSESGGGRSLVPSALDILPSSRPVGTRQYGP
jgi:hypothetical protein